MNSNSWDDRAAVQRRLVKALSRLTKTVEKITYTYNNLQEIVASIAALTNAPEWRLLAQEQAFKMVKTLSAYNAKTWREAASKSLRGPEIHRLLKAEFQNNNHFRELTRRNADLIRSLPNDVAKHVTEHAASQAIAGKRANELVEAIRKAAPELSQARVNLISRTETAKSQAAIVEVRAVNLGVDYYRWQTAEDQRVRSSHKHMQGVICAFASPPSPEELDGQPSVGYYGPGGIWNCRCFAAPIIDLDYEEFPSKVVQNGRIIRMTKKQFEAIQ